MLKKTAAILLILLLFFNWYGYRVMISVLQNRAELVLAEKLDQHQYDDADLMEVKVELNMPYLSSQSDFERHYGAIEIEGKSYTYVSRKIENGFLILKCIRNSEKDRINATGTEYFKMAAGVEPNQSSNNQKQHSLSIKSIWSDYDDHTANWQLASYTSSGIQVYKDHTVSLPAAYLSPAYHPPKFFSV